MSSDVWIFLVLIIALIGVAIFSLHIQREKVIAKAAEEGVEPDLSELDPRPLYVITVLFVLMLGGDLLRMEINHRHTQQILEQIAKSSPTHRWAVEYMEACAGLWGKTTQDCTATVLTLAESRGDKPQAIDAIKRWGSVREVSTGLEPGVSEQSLNLK